MDDNSSKNQKVTFEELPNEVLLSIFEYLNTDEVNSISKINERFKNLTYLLPPQKRLNPLHVNHPCRIREHVKEPCYSFDFYFSQGKSYIKRIRTIFSHHLDTIQQINIGNVSVMLAIKLCSQVNQNLRHLNLCYVDKDVFHPYDKIKINFPKLETLYVDKSGSFLKHIGENQITTCTLNNNEENVLKYEKFLENCKNLRILKIGDFIPNYHPDNHSYRLESLEFRNYQQPKTFRVRRFLIPHRDTLKKFILFDINTEATRIVIDEMKVEDFFLHFSNLTDEFDDDFDDNFSIKKLTLDIDSYNKKNTEFTQKIITACKGVEHLKIIERATSPTISPKTLKVAAENVNNLTHLTLPRTPNFYPEIIFENLEILTLSQLRSVEEHKSWIKLAINQPKLRVVKVSQILIYTKCEFSIPSRYLKKLLENCSNLEEMHLGPNFDITDDFLETILEYSGVKFWYLKIYSMNVDKDVQILKKLEKSKIRIEVVKGSEIDIY